MVLEIAYLFLREGCNISKPSGEHARKVIYTLLSTIQQLKDVKSVRVGQQVENPCNVEFLIEWTSVDAHLAFTQTSEYGPLTSGLAPFLEKAPIVYHADIDIDITRKGQITEHFSFLMSEIPDNFEHNANSLWDALAIEAKGFHGHSIKLSEDKATVDGAEYPVYVGLLAWDSVEAHMAARETDAFHKNVHNIRIPQVQQKIVSHVKFTDVPTDFGISGAE